MTDEATRQPPATATNGRRAKRGARFRLHGGQHPGPRGPRGRPSPPRHVHRLDRRARPASPRLGGRRQLDRRGDGRLTRPTITVTIADGRHRDRRRTTAAASRSASTQTGKDALEVVHTVLHAGGKFGGGGYKVSGGLHGVGVSVVNALSEWLRVESARDGYVWAQEYERGKPTSAGQEARPAGHSGAARTTAFRADPEMFETIDYSFDTISQRLRESAYLTKGVWITLDRRADRPRALVLLRGRPPVVRAAPQPEQGGPPQPPDLRRAQGGHRPRSRSRSSTTTRTPRTSSRSPTTSTRSTAARTSPASARR